MFMNEIICPHCKKAFKVDEAGYADILKQVRDSEFEKQLHERLELAEQDKRTAVELAQAKVASELQQAASAKDAEIQELKARLEAEEVARQFAVTQALSVVEKERDALANQLEQVKRDGETASQLAEAKLLNELQKTAVAKDSEIQKLQAKLEASEVAQKLAVSEALSTVEKDRDALASALEKVKQEKDTEAQLAEAKRLSDLQNAAATKNAEILNLQARLDAGEVAQKLALNMISTTVMIKLGRVKGNKMVDMQLTNNKLVDRGTHMIMDELGIDQQKAEALLKEYGSVRKAVDNYKKV